MAQKPQTKTPRFYINTGKYYRLTGLISRMKLAESNGTHLATPAGGWINPLHLERLFNDDPSDYTFITKADGLINGYLESSLLYDGIGDSGARRSWTASVPTGYDAINVNQKSEYDFLAILGHNFGTAHYGVVAQSGAIDYSASSAYSYPTNSLQNEEAIINWGDVNFGLVPYDGFSIVGFDKTFQTFTGEDGVERSYNEMVRARIWNANYTGPNSNDTTVPSPIDVKIGSVAKWLLGH